jgi:very-short-patch-repair endonuclease
MLASGSLRALTRGVFLVGGAPLTYRARLWTAVLATEGVLGFFTAARLWGVLELDELPVHVVLPHDRRVYPPQWVRLHRVPVATYGLASVGGFPTTERSWTVLDCLPKLARGDRLRLADRAVQRGWMRRADIARRLRDYPGRTGNTALRELAAQLSDGAAAQSERVLHRLLRQAGIAGWTPNYPVWFGGELIGVVDLAFPAKKIAVEVDGWAYHSDVDRFQRDRARQNDLIMVGWTVLRFTWADLVERPGYVRALVSRAAA